MVNNNPILEISMIQNTKTSHTLTTSTWTSGHRRMFFCGCKLGYVGSAPNNNKTAKTVSSVLIRLVAMDNYSLLYSIKQPNLTMSDAAAFFANKKKKKKAFKFNANKIDASSVAQTVHVYVSTCISCFPLTTLSNPLIISLFPLDKSVMHPLFLNTTKKSQGLRHCQMWQTL